MPLPMVALPWGSRSTSNTRFFMAASEAARFTQVVVLPTPPFWFAIAIILANVQSLLRFSAAGAQSRAQCHVHQVTLFRQTRHYQWIYPTYFTLPRYLRQFRRRINPFHGEKVSSGCQQVSTPGHHIRQGGEGPG